MYICIRLGLSSPTLPMMMAGMLEACMEITTDMGVTGESRRTSKPKYTTRNRKPGREETNTGEGQCLTNKGFYSKLNLGLSFSWFYFTMRIFTWGGVGCSQLRLTQRILQLIGQIAIYYVHFGILILDFFSTAAVLQMQKLQKLK